MLSYAPLEAALRRRLLLTSRSVDWTGGRDKATAAPENDWCARICAWSPASRGRTPVAA
jgi:hypothetical protein